MNADPRDGNEPERLTTRIDAVDARLLVHIERLDSGAAPEDLPYEGSPEDAGDTANVIDAHPRIGGESEK